MGRRKERRARTIEGTRQMGHEVRLLDEFSHVLWCLAPILGAKKDPWTSVGHWQRIEASPGCIPKLAQLAEQGSTGPNWPSRLPQKMKSSKGRDRRAASKRGLGIKSRLLRQKRKRGGALGLWNPQIPGPASEQLDACHCQFRIDAGTLCSPC
ncbi:hypothetical protein VTI74DRAFT_573 [Chaetomium olivicolor]